MKKVTGKEKISMYLIEYYFGYNKFITPLRIVGGPFFILLGFVLLYTYPSQYTVYYTGFSFLIGFFVIMRPFLYMLFRIENYRTEEIDINVNKDGITVIQKNTKSKIKFKDCQAIKERKRHFVFIFNRVSRIQIPKHFFNDLQYNILRNNFK